MERIPLISFVGPEGSGKSTQAKLLAQQLGFPYTSTGDMIRDAAANDKTQLGDACRKMFEEHSYLPAPLLLKIVANRLQKDDVAKGIVIDGGLRTLEETENFEKVLTEAGGNFDVKVVFLKLPAWEAADRLINGRKRSDDTTDAVLNRLKCFYDNLGKRISYIRNNWNFVMIPVSGKSIEEVNGEVVKAI